jgi:hypothetical protein
MHCQNLASGFQVSMDFNPNFSKKAEKIAEMLAEFVDAARTPIVGCMTAMWSRGPACFKLGREKPTQQFTV